MLRHFIKMLLQHIKKRLPVMVISESQKEALAICSNLVGCGLNGTYKAGSGGFTHSIKNRDIENFLLNPFT